MTIRVENTERREIFEKILMDSLRMDRDEAKRLGKKAESDGMDSADLWDAYQRSKFRAYPSAATMQNTAMAGSYWNSTFLNGIGLNKKFSRLFLQTLLKNQPKAQAKQRISSIMKQN